MEIEKKFNYKSTFFFSAGKKHNFDPNYSIKEKKITEVIKFLKDGGNEIGLHLSYLSYNNKKMMEKEKEELEYLAGSKIGTRTHFLRFKVPETWILERDSGFYYDSSLGYPDKIGYRNGFCWVYSPYVIGKEEEIKFFELPLSVMDSALFEESKTMEDAWSYLMRLFNNIEEYNGVITLDWHQRAFNEKYFKNWSLVYKKCLDHFKSRDAFVDLAGNIVEWINKRNLVFISKEANKNRIKFNIKAKTNIKNLAIKVWSKNTKARVYNSKGYEVINNKDNILIMFKEIKNNQKITIEM